MYKSCFFFRWVVEQNVAEKHRRCSEEDDACLWNSSEASVCFSFVKPNTGSSRRNPQTKKTWSPDHPKISRTSCDGKVSHFQHSFIPFPVCEFLYFWLIFATFVLGWAKFVTNHTKIDLSVETKKQKQAHANETSLYLCLFN